MLSVICPIYNEERYVAGCIESILAQDYPKDDLEIIFADGMSTDRTREIVSGYTVRFPWIRLIDNPDRTVSPALNRAIQVSRGDIIMRIDAHCEYPIDYFKSLTEALGKFRADNVGAVCVTMPINDTSIAKAISAVLSSKFGMGNSAFRVGVNEITQVDTVPFGCWPRNVFDKIGLFDEELIRNQDDEFNGRLTKAGGKILLIPSVKIKYYARDKISKVARMFYQYGLFKPLVNKKLGSPATIRQFIPPLLVLGIFVGAIMSFLWHPFIYPYIIGIGLYLGMTIFFSIKSSSDVRQFFAQAWTYIIVHFSYGWGYLIGLLKLLTNQSFVAKNNR